MKQNRGNHRLRKGSRSLASQYYLITTQTYLREPIFLDGDSSRIVMDALKWLDRNGHIFLDTAVIMPDHIHVLCQLNEGSLGNIAHKLKSFTSKQIGRLINREGSIWQSGYHDHAVRKDEDMNKIRLYCLNNPVRAKIVADFQDYPHWYCHYQIC